MVHFYIRKADSHLMQLVRGGARLIVEHISIMSITGATPTGNIHSYKYLVNVHTKNTVGSFYRKALSQAWKQSIIYKKRHMEITQNEIRIYLKKGDTIQKCIDHILKIIHQIKNQANLMQKKRKHSRKRRFLLKRIYFMKFYLLACKSNVRLRA